MVSNRAVLSKIGLPGGRLRRGVARKSKAYMKHQLLRQRSDKLKTKQEIVACGIEHPPVARRRALEASKLASRALIDS